MLFQDSGESRRHLDLGHGLSGYTRLYFPRRRYMLGIWTVYETSSAVFHRRFLVDFTTRPRIQCFTQRSRAATAEKLPRRQSALNVSSDSPMLAFRALRAPIAEGNAGEVHSTDEG